MQAKLYLIRHADTLPQEPGMTDKNRVLSFRGKEDCRRLGEFLQKQEAKLDAVKVSSAIRTRQTAKIIVKSLQVSDERVFYEDKIYNAPVSTLLTLVSGFDDAWQEVLLLGHNPSIAELGEKLLGSYQHFTAASCVVIRCDLENWASIESAKCHVDDEWHP